jgi:phosphoribosylanthranilate isomerase
MGRPVIKAVKVAETGDAEAAEAYAGAADLIVFDAKPSPALKNALPGGNGLSFDWRLLQPVMGKKPFMLSGGLTPENVAEAIKLTGAAIVDVSSGVEVAPGKKQAALIRRFLAAVKTQALEEVSHG